MQVAPDRMDATEELSPTGLVKGDLLTFRDSVEHNTRPLRLPNFAAIGNSSIQA
jgi:hypothetical protein